MGDDLKFYGQYKRLRRGWYRPAVLSRLCWQTSNAIQRTYRGHKSIFDLGKIHKILLFVTCYCDRPANVTLFNYYKAKEELVMALYNQVKNDSSQHSIADLEPTASSEVLFRSLFIRSVYWGLDNSDAFLYICLGLILFGRLNGHERSRREVAQNKPFRVHKNRSR